MAAELRATLVLVDGMTGAMGKVTGVVQRQLAKIGTAFSNVGKAVFSLRSAFALIGGYAIINSFKQTAAASKDFKDRLDAIGKKWEDFKLSVLRGGVFDFFENALNSWSDSFGDTKDSAQALADVIVTGMKWAGYAIGGVATAVQLAVQGFKTFELGLNALGVVVAMSVRGWMQLADAAASWLPQTSDIVTLRGNLGKVDSDALTLQLKYQESTSELKKQVLELSNQELAHVKIWNAVDDAVAKQKQLTTATKETAIAAKAVWFKQTPDLVVADGFGPDTRGDALNNIPMPGGQRASMVSMEDVGASTIKAQNDAIAKSIEAQNAALEKQRSLYESIRGTVESLANIIGTAFMGFMDDLVENKVKPLRDYFKDILRDMGRFMMQMAMQQMTSALAGAVAGGLSGGGSVRSGINQRPLPMRGKAQGGVLPSPYARIPLRAYASGGMTPGITSGAEMWLVGEGNRGRKREAIIPLENNRHVKAVVQDGGGMTVINNNYISAMDSASFEDKMLKERRSVRIAQNRNYREHPGVTRL